jgi:rubrerythrin
VIATAIAGQPPAITRGTTLELLPAMSRNALRRYLSGLVIASLPACCRTEPERVFYQRIDPAILDSVDGGVPAEKLPPEICKEVCRTVVDHCRFVPLDAGSDFNGDVACVQSPAHEVCSGPLPGGRPPPGLRPPLIEGDDPVGVYFAYMAHVEGAAVHGFLQLALELQNLGAPRELVRAAQKAAADEARHAAIARRLARRSVPAVEIDATPPRGAFQIALDNAVEGGVFETYAVLTCQWQSRMAADARTRAAFCRIAEDELRHAEVAQAVAAWLEPQLDDAERRQIARARQNAAARLAAQVETPMPAALVAAAGLPPPEVARAWVADLTQRLWS